VAFLCESRCVSLKSPWLFSLSIVDRSSLMILLWGQSSEL